MHLVSGVRSDNSKNEFAKCFPVKSWFDEEYHECVRILRRAQKKKKSRMGVIQRENRALYIQ